MSVNDMLNKLAAQGKDQSTAQAGGDFELPAAGKTGLRLIGYYELGKHEEEWEGKKSLKDKVRLVFEAVGKKHPPRELPDGSKMPVRFSVDMTLSLFQRSAFFQLFSKLRTDEKHFAQLLGKAFLGDVVHVESKRSGKKYAKVDKSTICKPFLLERADLSDPESELVEKPYPVGPAITPQGLFLWEYADAASFDALYIPGEFPERKDEKTGEITSPARSKNVLQLEIASAVNFKGLPCFDYAASRLAGDGKITKEDAGQLDEAIGDVVNATPRAEADIGDDPMAGIG